MMMLTRSLSNPYRSLLLYSSKDTAGAVQQPSWPVRRYCGHKAARTSGSARRQERYSSPDLRLSARCRLGLPATASGSAVSGLIGAWVLAPELPGQQALGVESDSVAGPSARRLATTRRAPGWR